MSVSVKRDPRALFEIEFNTLSLMFGQPKPNFSRGGHGQYVDARVRLYWLTFYRGYRLGGGHE